MTIQIDGTNTVNKGAELMLYAVLQEIERKYPDAKVLYNQQWSNPNYIRTKLNFGTRPFAHLLIPVLNKCKVHGILRRLSVPCSFLTLRYPIKGLDLVLDAGGFQFGDQWNISDYDLLLWENYYRKLKKQGTKIILLPQAFGPFETKNGKKIVGIVSKYTDIIFAREEVSYNHLIKAGADGRKIKLYPDFTALVEGIIPKRYEFLKDGICIIPNKRMIDKSTVLPENYFSFLEKIIQIIQQQGKSPFLLNHESKSDFVLCELINQQLKVPLTIVNNLTALEIKGVISQSYLVVSSRFHGVASALNSGVPCLATSWSHKYAELFKDYRQSDCVLDLSRPDKIREKVRYYLSDNVHKSVSEILPEAKRVVVEKNKEMWNIVWKSINQ
jgi:colanic acid/amylovoran biosynthesis protein